MKRRFFYLFASSSGKCDESAQTVFYKTNTESFAKGLCELFAKEYADANGNPTFHLKDAQSISPEDQVLLDELLDLLALYDEPDPGIYDPEPSADVHLRAQYAVRANKWEELFMRQAPPRDQGSELDNKESVSREMPGDELPEVLPEEERNSVLILLMLLAQAYYKMLESTISMASIVTELDLELNQSYFWTVKIITNLLKNSEHLRDFPIPFEPLFDDLYPSTIGDVDWRDGVALDAERFLSTVQRYVLAKGISQLEEGSPGWSFIELFRPSVNAAIDRAVKYDARMRKYYQRFLASSCKTTESEPKAESNIGAGNQPKSNNTSSCTRDKIFVSYSHKDKKLFEEFKTMLAPAIRNGGVDFWDDTRIEPGARWKEEIQAALSSAKVAVLLVSKDFLASDFIAQDELPPLLKAARDEGVTIFWIYLSHCLYKQTEIAAYECAHSVSTPLNDLKKPRREEELKRISDKLIQLAQKPSIV